MTGKASGAVHKAKIHSDVLNTATARWYDPETEICHRKETHNAADLHPAREKKLMNAYGSQGRVIPSPAAEERSTAANAYENDRFLDNRRQFDSAFSAQKICSHDGNAFEEKLEIRRIECRDQQPTVIGREGAKEKKMRMFMGEGVVEAFGNAEYSSEHRDRNRNNFDQKAKTATHGYSKTLRGSQGETYMTPENPIQPASPSRVRKNAAANMQSFMRKATDLRGQLKMSDM